MIFEQTTLNIKRDKKETRLTIKLDNADIQALEKGMLAVGETNRSSFVRRIIHEFANKNKL